MQSSISIFIFAVLGYLAFGIWAIVWISKKKKAGEKISLRAKIIIAAVFLSSSSVLLSTIELSPPASPSESVVYYVKSGSANVRECPFLSCKVIGTYPQNTKLTFPEDLFDKYPDWAEVTFPDGRVGYINKITLSSEVSVEPQPQDNGIALAQWNFDPLEVGVSYGISFCIPVSARSGATCGGLAGETQTPVGGSPPYSFVKSSGFLPPGMSLELNGLLSGSPTTAGTYNFKLCAKDLSMNQGCENFTLVVEKENVSIVSPPTDYTGSDSSNPPLSPVKEEPSMPVIASFECTRGAVFPGSQLLGEGGYYFTVTAMGTISGPVDTVFGIGNTDLKISSCGSWEEYGSSQLLCYRSSESMPEEINWTVSARNRTSTYKDIIVIEASLLPREIKLPVYSSLYFGGGESKKTEATAICQ